MSLEKSCRATLDQPGNHQISVAVHSIKWFKTGDKRVTMHASSIDVRDEEDYSRGKRLSLDKITCGK